MTSDIHGTRRDMGPPAPPGAPDILRTMDTVEAVLVAENWFFEKVREELAKKAPLSDFEVLNGANGHDHLLHFTQFLFSSRGSRRSRCRRDCGLHHDL